MHARVTLTLLPSRCLFFGPPFELEETHPDYGRYLPHREGQAVMVVMPPKQRLTWGDEKHERIVSLAGACLTDDDVAQLTAVIDFKRAEGTFVIEYAALCDSRPWSPAFHKFLSLQKKSLD